MAYEPQHLQVVVPGMSNTNNKVWALNTVDATAAATAAEYISDGVNRGMMQGELVMVKQRASLPAGDATTAVWCMVSVVGTGVDGLAVDLVAI